MPDRTDAQRAEERALEALGEPWRTDYQDWKKHASITTVPGTLRKYQQAVLGEFLPWVLQQPDIKQASDLTPRHFVRFTDYLRVTPNKKNGEKRSSATVRSYQVPTSLFLDWLAGLVRRQAVDGRAEEALAKIRSAALHGRDPTVARGKRCPFRPGPNVPNQGAPGLLPTASLAPKVRRVCLEGPPNACRFAVS